MKELLHEIADLDNKCLGRGQFLRGGIQKDFNDAPRLEGSPSIFTEGWCPASLYGFETIKGENQTHPKSLVKFLLSH